MWDHDTLHITKSCVCVSHKYCAYNIVIMIVLHNNIMMQLQQQDPQLSGEPGITNIIVDLYYTDAVRSEVYKWFKKINEDYWLIIPFCLSVCLSLSPSFPLFLSLYKDKWSCLVCTTKHMCWFSWSTLQPLQCGSWEQLYQWMWH